MKISIIGTGYVGLVAGACLADLGSSVICVDNNKKKIDDLNNGIIPIFEPELEKIIDKNVKEKRLSFSCDINNAIKNSKVCFIAVGTPQKEDGSVELGAVFDVVIDIAKAMNGYKIIVNKSTVPVGTLNKLREIIKTNTKYPFDIVSNPEFLRQGSAVCDFLNPERIIIGSNSDKAADVLKEIYLPVSQNGKKIFICDVKSAEMVKYASNAFLATKISFINEIANLCEKTGADIDLVRTGMSLDSRIGDKFLFPGIGYGGSCFPKDVKALIKMGLENSCDMSIVNAVQKANDKQIEIFINKIIKKYGENLKGLTFALWGLSFKPNTNDMRHAPSIKVINELIKRDAKIQAYDPKAMESSKKNLPKNNIIYCKNAYDTLENADCLLLLTEWSEFKNPDFDRIKKLLKTPVIFDGRNQYDTKHISKKNIEYYCIGKK